MGKSLEIAVRSFPNVDRGELQLWDRERRGGGNIGVGKRRKRKEPEGKVSKKIYRISLSGSPKSGSPTL